MFYVNGEQLIYLTKYPTIDSLSGVAILIICSIEKVPETDEVDQYGFYNEGENWISIDTGELYLNHPLQESET